jgi:hypothetical protein
MKYDELDVKEKIALFNTAINMVSRLNRNLISSTKQIDELVKEVLKVAKVISANLDFVLD